MKRFILLAFIVGCGGADGTQLFEDSGAPPQDSSLGVDVAVPDAQPDSTVGPPDAADDVKVADVTPDLHTGPPDSKIQCGPSLSCSAQTQVCCWHSTSTFKPYECVADVSACNATDDVPITCSSKDNCTSQGNPSYTCCATGGGFGSGTCLNADIATDVSCKSSCNNAGEYEVGCSVTLQNCADTLQTCIVSKCTDPGATICN